MNNKLTHRLFFALWPDVFIQQKIFTAFTRSAAFQNTQCTTHTHIKQRYPKIYKPENLHLTVHFLGNISLRDMECVDKAASTVTAKTFSLNLNCYGHFEDARVFWMGTNEPPENLFHLHAALAKNIAHCSLPLDDRSYAPHVTLMRNTDETGSVINAIPVRWDVKQFALVESVSTPQGVSYQPLKFYNLSHT